MNIFAEILASFLIFLLDFRDITKILCLGNICPPQFEHFCKHFRAVSILFHVWVPSAHPSICESVVLLLNFVSLLSMWLFVNLAHILINVYVHISVLVTGRKHVAAVC